MKNKHGIALKIIESKINSAKFEGNFEFIFGMLIMAWSMEIISKDEFDFFWNENHEYKNQFLYLEK
ncbi:MAG: hypothetical protein QM689_12835 [Oscillospiraceae bacterium]